MDLVHLMARVVSFSIGAFIVAWTVASAVRTFVMPRAQNAWLTSTAFRLMYKFVFRPAVERASTYEDKDRILAFYSPFTVVMLPFLYLTMIWIGFTGMFWAVSERLGWRESLIMSGSSLMTLGFRFENELAIIVLAFIEAALGMMFIALLIGYLPTMYSAFSSRERWVNKLEVRAGSPPSAAVMIERLDYTGMLYDTKDLYQLWKDLEDWFVDLEEYHTTLAPLNFFRSPKPHMSWVTSAGVVLDCASLIASTVDIPRRAQSGLCIRAGFVALRSIADFFEVKYTVDPKPDDPISVTREQFDATYDRLVELGIPVLEDRDQCWKDFAGWRVNYDTVLRTLAKITFAPYAEWISDHMQDAPGIMLAKEINAEGVQQRRPYIEKNIQEEG